MDIYVGNSGLLKTKGLDGFVKKESWGEFEIFVKESTSYNHYYSFRDIQENKLYIVWGNIYESFWTNSTSKDVAMKYLIDLYKKDKEIYIKDVDGEFNFIVLTESENIVEVYTDREGIMPLYYRKHNVGIEVTSQADLLFDDYSEYDIDLNSINDFLLFGTLVGDRTMSKKVKMLQGGTYLKYYNKNEIELKRFYRFQHIKSSDKIDKIVSSVVEAYKKALVKRIKGKENDSCLFLSGGMDSRFVLGCLNDITEGKIETYTFGQEKSEEVYVAQQTAEVMGNPFKWIKIFPKDFVKYAEEYERITCGGDMFPQGYIMGMPKSISKNNFFSGYGLDVYLGDYCLNEEAVTTGESILDFVKNNLNLLHMSVFSKDELLRLATSEGRLIFERDLDDVVEIVKSYNNVSVKDGIQALEMELRYSKMILWRELLPAKQMDCSYACVDRDFLKECAKIPPECQIGHKFYQLLFEKLNPEYAKLVYNNTNLPVVAPVEMWKEGIKQELECEKIYEKVISDYNTQHDDKIYYRHYYSDFNGYSRYDSSWLGLFYKYLLSPDAYIYRKWFRYDRVKEMFDMHISGKINKRKELVYLTSLEIFLHNKFVK